MVPTIMEYLKEEIRWTAINDKKKFGLAHKPSKKSEFSTNVRKYCKEIIKIVEIVHYTGDTLANEMQSSWAVQRCSFFVQLWSND